MPDQIIKIQNVNKWFGDFQVLKDINLNVDQKQKIVVCGPSGSGKSTLIRCINRLEAHQKGEIIVNGIELSGNLKNLEAIRSDVGMVFQSFNLFPHLSVLENCTLAPIWVRKMTKKDADELAMEYLKRVKIPEQAYKFPGQLSGGQQQRVAIARALSTNPSVLIADEPTGQLDSNNTENIFNILKNMVKDYGTTVILTTHDIRMMNYADNLFEINSGNLTKIQ